MALGIQLSQRIGSDGQVIRPCHWCDDDATVELETSYQVERACDIHAENLLAYVNS